MAAQGQPQALPGLQHITNQQNTVANVLQSAQQSAYLNQAAQSNLLGQRIAALTDPIIPWQTRINNVPTTYGGCTTYFGIELCSSLVSLQDAVAGEERIAIILAHMAKRGVDLNRTNVNTNTKAAKAYQAIRDSQFPGVNLEVLRRRMPILQLINEVAADAQPPQGGAAQAGAGPAPPANVQGQAPPPLNIPNPHPSISEDQAPAARDLLIANLSYIMAKNYRIEAIAPVTHLASLALFDGPNGPNGPNDPNGWNRYFNNYSFITQGDVVQETLQLFGVGGDGPVIQLVPIFCYPLMVVSREYVNYRCGPIVAGAASQHPQLHNMLQGVSNNADAVYYTAVHTMCLMRYVTGLQLIKALLGIPGMPTTPHVGYPAARDALNNKRSELLGLANAKAQLIGGAPTINAANQRRTKALKALNDVFFTAGFISPAPNDPAFMAFYAAPTLVALLGIMQSRVVANPNSLLIDVDVQYAELNDLARDISDGYNAFLQQNPAAAAAVAAQPAVAAAVAPQQQQQPPAPPQPLPGAAQPAVAAAVIPQQQQQQQQGGNQ